MLPELNGFRIFPAIMDLSTLLKKAVGHVFSRVYEPRASASGTSPFSAAS
jgi:hypothetical protein